jgi:hypothetical protein
MGAHRTVRGRRCNEKLSRYTHLEVMLHVICGLPNWLTVSKIQSANIEREMSQGLICLCVICPRFLTTMVQANLFV